MRRLTNVEFAQQCAFIAKNAAAWAADSLTLPEYRERPVDERVAERFCRDLEGWVSHIRTALNKEGKSDE